MSKGFSGARFRIFLLKSCAFFFWDIFKSYEISSLTDLLIMSQNVEFFDPQKFLRHQKFLRSLIFFGILSSQFFVKIC